MDVPRVSVVMPVYNTADYLKEAIDSILNQTFSDFEFLTINDGSTDGSLEILQDYAAQDRRIRVVDQTNQGVTATFNRGIDLARGEYLARMDSDDIAVPSRLAQQVQFLDLNPDVVALSGWFILIDEEGDPLAISRPSALHEQIDRQLLAQCPAEGGGIFGHCTAMMRTTALRAIGGARVEFEPTDDRDLYLRLSERGRLHNLQTVIHRYRQHTGSISGSRLAAQRRESRRAVLEAYRRRGLDPPHQLHYPAIAIPATPAERHRGLARWSAANGFYGTAIKHSWRAFRYEPWSNASVRVIGVAWLAPVRRYLRDRHRPT